jgi:hypothetical protein
MRLAVPDIPLVDPLLRNAEAVCGRLGWTLQRVPVDQCAELLAANRVEAALISPLAYGQASGVVDYHIVPQTCVALVDFTNVMGITFPADVPMINTIGAEQPTDFLVIMGALMLQERFEARGAGITQLAAGGAATAPAVDSIIAAPRPGAELPMLDVSEEFFDLAESPLPAFLWVYRMEADVDALPAALAEMADAELPEAVVREPGSLTEDHFPREGRIQYRWTDEVEEGLTAVLNLLYFHQYLTNLPDIKLHP